MSILNLYFHKDFDGFAAAALFLRINEESQLVGATSTNLKTVDYHLKKSWLRTALPSPNVVVDFLYHPRADWWFDHHVTTFLQKRHRNSYCNSDKQFWDHEFPSCAALIKHHLQKYCTLFMSEEEFNSIMEGFREWIHWSDIIDNARYDSPAQVVEMEHPCLKINATLTADTPEHYFQHLVMSAKLFTPREVTETAPVKKRIDEIMLLREKHMQIFKENYRAGSNGAVFFDYAKHGIPFQRYLAYYYEPDAPYSVGVYPREGNFSISVGKNPWRDFKSKNIGEICKKYGGGGRENVGAVNLPTYRKALETAEKICGELYKKA